MVFSHKIVRISVVNVVLLLIVPVISLLIIGITLRLRIHGILIHSRFQHRFSISLILFLSLLKDLVDTESLLVVHPAYSYKRLITFDLPSPAPSTIASLGFTTESNRVAAVARS